MYVCMCVCVVIVVVVMYVLCEGRPAMHLTAYRMNALIRGFEFVHGIDHSRLASPSTSIVPETRFFFSLFLLLMLLLASVMYV